MKNRVIAMIRASAVTAPREDGMIGIYERQKSQGANLEN